MPAAPVEVRIRAATPGDAPVIAEMASRLRKHHGDPTDHLITDRIVADGFGPDPAFRIAVADAAAVPIGYALFHPAYEPTYAARGVYLADLYVEADWRRRGVGRMLVEAVADASRAEGGSFVWWVVRQGNDSALKFYDALDLIGRAEVIAHAIAAVE